MIDIEHETLISLAEAAAALPCGRKGRRFPDVKTVYSWTTNGCRGVLLESVQVGGRRCTSREAIRRFVEALTTATGPSPKQRVARLPNAAQQQAVEAELNRLGVMSKPAPEGERK